MRIDLHTHSTASDGTFTPGRLVVAAAEAGLDVVAITVKVPHHFELISAAIALSMATKWSRNQPWRRNHRR